MRDLVEKAHKEIHDFVIENEGKGPEKIAMHPDTFEVLQAELAHLELTANGVEVAPSWSVLKTSAGEIIFEGLRVFLSPNMFRGVFVALE